ncbi:hypothetical protein ACIBL5_05960 [Streptomyces sp. NPDC050516]|uniref:hypothetical protein n=1 Tax=Streptomyces sp. NPDC050516 TaxID=3365621 RepID=UPI0037BA8D30
MTDTADPQPKPTLSVADFRLLADPLTDQLGDWEVLDGVEPGQDSTIHLLASNRRGIGLRHQFNGQAVQLFAVGATAPAPPAGQVSAPTAHRLAEGVRYSTAVFFTAGEAPLESILTAIRTVLLPAFEGHRPLLDLHGRRPAPPVETASAEQPSAEPAADSTPKPRARKASTTRAKATKPTRRATPGKNLAAAASA